MNWLTVIRTASRRLAAVAVVLLVAGLAGAAVTPLAGETAVLSEVAAARSEALTTAARVATHAGDLWVVTVVAVAVAVAVRRSASATRTQVVLLLALGGSMFLIGVLKLVVGRERPADGLVATTSAAYPSGHAARAAVVCGLLVWAWHRTVDQPVLRAVLVVVTVVLAAAMAASRVYLGVHLPSDVLVGVVIGGVWTAAVLRFTAPDEQHGR